MADIADSGADGPPAIDPRVSNEIVAFLRDWLPEVAKRTYRRMIASDPHGWHEDPHFESVIVQHALRGNGITEEALGIESLASVWPELLRRAVDLSPAAPTDRSPGA